MKHNIEMKIKELLDYILDKPIEEVTPNDYLVLDTALRNIRAEEAEKERSKEFAARMAQLVSIPFRGVMAEGSDFNAE